MEKKSCYHCKIEKPFSDFRKDRFTKSGRRSWCRDCEDIASKAAYEIKKQDPAFRAHRVKTHLIWSRNNKENTRHWNLVKHGLSLERYDKMLAEQEGRCAVCRTDQPGGKGNVFQVDHDHRCCAKQHSCGKCIRGLLCHRCNQRLSRGWDNIAFLSAMLAYAQKPWLA